MKLHCIHVSFTWSGVLIVEASKVIATELARPFLNKRFRKFISAYLAPRYGSHAFNYVAFLRKKRRSLPILLQDDFCFGSWCMYNTFWIYVVESNRQHQSVDKPQVFSTLGDNDKHNVTQHVFCRGAATIISSDTGEMGNDGGTVPHDLWKRGQRKQRCLFITAS